MPIESILISVFASVFLALIGVVWWQLQGKIESNRLDACERSLENARDIALNSAAIASLGVKLAKDYHDRSEVRQTFTDLVAPINQQLGVIQGMLQSILGVSNFNVRPPNPR